jgi:sodium transport system permease protein
MRWSVVRLICLRELRDQLRDRRTVLMIAVLPLVLYPALGILLGRFALEAADRPSIIGVAGAESLPVPLPTSAGWSPLPVTGWLSAIPDGAGGLFPGRFVGAMALTRAARALEEYPPLLVGDRIPARYFSLRHEALLMHVVRLDDGDRGPLDAKQVDVLLRVPADFRERLEGGGRPQLLLLSREQDDRSRMAARRVHEVLGYWEQALREVRLLRRGIPAGYDEPFSVRDPELEKPTEEVAAEGLLGLFVRIFPFLLVMWSLAGALYPAVDLCAGEKERGTMETLLISPASREEIVWGKFLTIWIASAATALLNLVSMGITTRYFSRLLTHDVLRPVALLWCVLLLVPLSAFFSAICLAVGAYARSSKEGQYYLMPLFLITMPLVFLTLAPGVELNPFYSLVPVTGVALLMQRLMTTTLDKVPWLYFIPVLAPIVLYSWLALRWAVEQFKREEVLFREAERLDVGLWLRRLFREKEPLPSAGQACFCFALILFLRTLSFDQAGGSLLVRTGVTYLAFVTAPPLFMALLLTTRPRQALALRLPPLSTFLAAVALAGLLLVPLSELTLFVLRQFPLLRELLDQRQPLVEELHTVRAGEGTFWWQYLLVFAVLGAICEELAFRGFILSGLRRRFGPWMAIVFSSLLFALYHMNVFQVIPAFVLGVVLGVLAVRGQSVVPAIVLHLLYNGVLLGAALLPQFASGEQAWPAMTFLRPVLAAVCTALALLLVGALGVGLRARKVDSASAPPVTDHIQRASLQSGTPVRTP